MATAPSHSPFPGMDPYVERPDLWPELHNPLMIYARDAIQPRLPENYVARLELRIYVEREEQPPRPAVRIPDLELVRTGITRRSPAAIAVQQDDEEPAGYWIERVPIERREVILNVRAGDGELVTSVELLSPSNKRPGPGRDAYLQKQSELLGSAANLVEIDLLRAGHPTVAATEPELEALPDFDYLTCIFRAERPSGLQVIPWTVRQPFPSIPIPLGPGQAALRLDLAELFRAAYVNGAFPRLIDYGREPEPPFRPEDAAWADALLREAGLRGTDA